MINNAQQFRALVVFESESTSARPFAKSTAGGLAKLGWSPYVEYVSDIRDPMQLDQLLRGTKVGIIVAGAGALGRLPIVISSKTQAPVVTVMTGEGFGGMTGLLAVTQAPTGMPVLGLPPVKPAHLQPLWCELGRRLACLPPGVSDRGGRVCVRFVGDKKVVLGNMTYEARAILDYVSANWSVFNKGEEGVVNIVAAPEGKVPAGLKLPRNCLPIFVPVFNPAKLEKPETALTLLKNISALKEPGFWVKPNSFINAVCAALQFNNNSRRYDHILNIVKKGEFRA